MENEHNCDCGCCSDTEMTKVEMTIHELNEIIYELDDIKEYLNELVTKAERVNLVEEASQFKEYVKKVDELLKYAEDILNNEAAILEVKEKSETIPEELKILQNRLYEIKEIFNKIE